MGGHRLMPSDLNSGSPGTGYHMLALDDDTLISLIHRGDSSAFEALVERHYTTIFNIAFRWCRNRDDAEDITQDACIRLGRGISSFRGESRFTTWLYRLVVNAATDWQRKHARSSGIEEPPEPLRNAIEHPDAENRLHARRMLTEIDALPEKEKQAVLLVFAEGVSHREAADILRCAESTISWRIHSARQRLRDALKHRNSTDRDKEQGRG